MLPRSLDEPMKVASDHDGVAPVTQSGLGHPYFQKPPVTVNLVCQLDWIEKHLGG